jgi:hypothetical protein
MPLGREIDDVAGIAQGSGMEYEHAARKHFLIFAGNRISFEVFEKFVLELQSDTPPHHAHAVHSIDQSLDIGLK